MAGDAARILMFPMGSAGDIYPYAGIGKELRSHGYHVALTANSYFEPLALKADLEFCSAGSTEEYFEVIHNPDLWQEKGGYRLMFNKMLDAMTFIYRQIEQKYVPGKTVVVAPSIAFGARIANERLGVPLVSVNVETNIFRSMYEQPGREWPRALKPLLPPLRRAVMSAADRWFFDPHLLPRINAFRGELGLAPVERVMLRWLHSPQCVVGMFPEWFSGRQPDWPLNLHLTGFPLFDESEDSQLDVEVCEFLSQGDPPIVFTLGSAMRFAQEFFRVSVEAVVRLRRRAILLTRFAEQAPHPLPEGVRHFAYVPLSRLLPRAAAIVHHGGIGTTSQGLRAGIPQLITPMIFDQPHNAARLRRLGVGDILANRDYKTGAVAGMLTRLMESAGVRANCRAVAARFNGVDSLARTAGLIESVLTMPFALPSSRLTSSA